MAAAPTPRLHTRFLFKNLLYFTNLLYAAMAE